MLKKGLLLLILALGLSIQQGKSQSLEVSFTTTSIAGAEYSPSHVLAVWVKDSNGKYVKTLAVYAKQRIGYLTKWSGSSGGDKTDAVTGATLTNHQTKVITWNLTNYAGTKVANGTYTLCLEQTSTDFTGPYREVSFTVSDADQILTPEDGSNFTNIQIKYENGVASATQFDVSDNYLKIISNGSGRYVAEVNLFQESDAQITIFNVNGGKVGETQQRLIAGKQEVDLTSALSSLSRGNYLVLLKTNHYTVGKQFVKP